MFTVLGWLVWAMWASLVVTSAILDEQSRETRVSAALMGLVGASWTLWALFRG